MAIIVSILGYAKSGKTSFAEALLRRLRAAGFTAGAIKAGRSVHEAQTTESAARAERSRGAESRGLETTARATLPDSRRLAVAGADPVIFWTEDGARREGTPAAVSLEPLPSRERFAREWQRLLPPDLTEALQARDLLLLEGRVVPEALVVQMRQQESGAIKYPRIAEQILVKGAEDFAPAAEEILRRLEERGYAR